jgi:5-methylcytosine-specific restriction protein A
VTLGQSSCFALHPVGDVLRREEDRSEYGEPPETTDVTVTSDTAAEVAVTDLEAHEADTYETSGGEPKTAVRREAALVKRYRKALQAEGHKLSSRRIRPAGEHRRLWTDLYDDTTDELCEAKGVTTRETVRHVLGQLLDYQRHVKAESLAALLPTRPSDDLLDLLHSQGVTCVYESGDGFVRVPPTTHR